MSDMKEAAKVADQIRLKVKGAVKVKGARLDAEVLRRDGYYDVFWRGLRPNQRFGCKVEAGNDVVTFKLLDLSVDLVEKRLVSVDARWPESGLDVVNEFLGMLGDREDNS